MSLETLISAVQERPAIWLSRHHQHKNKFIVKKMWEEIKELMPEYEVEDLKKKWKNLKDSFRKEIKKIPIPRSGSAANAYESQWQYFNLMNFIREEVIPLPNEDNITDDTQDASTEVVDESTDIASPTSPSSNSNISSNKQTLYSKKRLNANEIRSEYLDIERKKLKLMEMEIAKKSNDDGPEKSEDYHFLMSLLPQIEKLNPVQKLRLRNKFNEALMEEILLNMYADYNYRDHSGDYQYDRGYNTEQN